MKTIKRTMRNILVILIIMMVVINTSFAEGTKTFSDIKNHWGETDINYLINLKVIDGFPDGTFKPNGTLQIDQFIKMCVTGLGFTDIENGDSYWASTYIEKAIEIGLIESNEINNYKKEITRKLMARVIVYALEYLKTNTSEDLIDKSDIYLYKSSFVDYRILDSSYIDFIALAYKYGLIGGYPDGNYKQNNNATRAEASTMLCRLVNPIRRLEVTTPVLSELMTHYNKGSVYEDYIVNTADDYTNSGFYKFEDGKYVCTRSSYTFNMFADGYRPSEDYHPNLREKIYDVANVLYSDETYVRIRTFDHESAFVAVELAEIKIFADHDNYDFSFWFYEKEPEYAENLLISLNIRALRPQFTDSSLTTYFTDNVFITDAYRNKLLASMIALFGEVEGENIGNFIIAEYLSLYGFNHEKVQIFGNIKVRSFTYDRSTQLHFYFYIVD